MSHAFLRLVSSSGEQSYSLLTTGEMVIGRDHSCQIVLDSNTYPMVSRRHGTIRPSRTLDGRTSFVLCDLKSGNGTYLNGHRLQGCQELHGGDRISFGNNGPEFVFEYQLNHQSIGVVQPAVTPTPTTAVNSASPNTDNDASWSQLLPIFSSPKDLYRKAYLIPGIITVVFVILLFVVKGIWYQLLLGIYLAGAALYFVYQLCGKPKPWWVIIAAAVFTAVILITPVLSIFILVFRQLLPGNVPTNMSTIAFPELFIRFFFGAGLLEELLKALPIIGFYFLGKRLSSPWRERIGVWEPLDGILLGSASAVGFTLVETLGQYVPGTIAQVAETMGPDAGLRAGLELLIPRILGEVAGHMAWSGWFGYCIGLSVLKPRQAWRILAIGYLSAAGLHALWNVSAGLTSTLGIFVLGWLLLIGGLSYALLVAAILKGRTLSPTRSQNFATRFFNS
ncbi:MAG: PrsW family intramembrane metalloprotease [Stigonema ocellatum SAG 48.90 = DSM 106950]|nr:PrsW family intramembrane metalloprotease [Stigonema ocellatum SAG 48.90 = DSM 106950]